MKHPPYHLRMNKTVDRYLLVEIMSRIGRMFSMAEYTYYGFGGPYLEDCRLLHEFFFDMKLVSIERDRETFKRQKFNRFSKKLHLINKDIKSFLAQDFAGKGKEVFWLDYVDNRYNRFVEFMEVLQKVGEYSVVKITLPAVFSDNPFGRLAAADRSLNKWQLEFIDNFNKEYRDVIPSRLVDGKYLYRDKPLELLPIMLRIAAEKALPTSGGIVYRCLNVAHYNDGTPMLSVAGITCPVEKVGAIDALFADWKFNSLSWDPVRKIDMPFLSMKEILKLESQLPTEAEDGIKMAETLGYIIDKDHTTSLEKLRQYEYFYRYYPRFVRASI